MHLVIILFALFASLFTLQKETLNFSEPFFLVGFKMSLAGLLLLVYAKITNKTSTFHVSHIKLLALLTMSQIYLGNICEIWGLKYMESSKACLIFSLSPFLAAIIAFIALKETLSPKKWLGMFVGFVGLIPILFTQTQQEFASGNIFIFSYAEIVLLIAVICQVYGWIVLKKVLQELHYSPIFANSISMLFGGILALIHSFLSGESWHPIPVNNLRSFLMYSTIMCLISNIICYNLYGVLLKRFSATFMSFAGLICPMFASLFGFIFLDEIISWHFFASMALFAIGLMIFHQQEIIHSKLPRKTL
jgi:drug/metabolite transporter (DMT)-like permease